jgi:4-hydroxyphenylpyruvate dioxygenase
MARHAIATVCLSGTLPDKLEAAAAAGFDAIELFEQDLLGFDAPAAEVRRLCDWTGLSVALYQPFRDFEAMPEPQRQRNLDRAERKFDTMQAVGAELVLVCSNTQASAIDDAHRAAADLRAMAERAAARGLRVGYEALAWGRHVNRWRQAWDIVRMADHPALGLILDSFHTLALGDSLDGLAATVPAEKLFFVQLADAPKLSMDPLSWSRHHRSFPGQGELPVAGFVREVARAGYQGPLSLEVFNDEFRAAPARRIARDAKLSLAWLEEQAGLSPLPAMPALRGIEFVEFAVDEAAGEALGTMLRGLGFRRAGRHRSKQVEWWANGAANLVLNAEPDSAAAERFEQVGASACALALRVDDPARAIARAEALKVPVWHERHAADERDIPAVRAPDGTLVYIVPDAPGRSIWEDDFVSLPGAAQPAPALGIDHVAQAVAPGMLDGVVLFWRALFGLAPDALWELPDPFGLVQSRALVSPDGAVRLPLNTAESGRTLTGRFVSAFAGSGVHHVAFGFDDAAAAVDAARAAGAALLKIPANYFDDLAARHPLDDAALAALAARGLLYDRDASGGEFRHAYTAAFDEKFFFELCARAGRYAGFGAANAAVRLAAQQRR